MKKYLLLALFLPIFSFGQQVCTTIIPNNNATSVVYCVTNTSCHDVCDGIISITVDGINGPYSYNWSIDGNAFLGGTIQDTLCPGEYIITITDVNGALVDNSEINTIGGPPNFSVFTNALNNPTCFNSNDGSIDLTINGATPFDPDGIVGSGDEYYTYLWEESSATEDRTLLDSGLYILSMTDANGCNRIDSFELFNPAEVISETITDTLSCIGACDGEAIVTPSDGVAPYTYQWSNGDTDSTAIGLCYGTNTVTITDVNGCIATNTVTIANPDTLQLSNITIDSSCYQICDGQLSATIEGGKSPYDIEWSFEGIIFNTTDPITNNDLCPGDYQFVFTDANNCSDTVTIPLIERDSFLLASSVINDSCYNSCTGQITVELLNQDNPPFDYYWMPDGQTDSVISNLCSDNFELILIDARLCKDTFEFFVDEPDSLSYDTIIVTHNLCYGDENGAITIGNLTGGVLPITYSWSNGETSTIPGISSLPADMYSIHIEDANECAIDVANIEVTESDSLHVFYTPLDASCYGYSDGSISINLTGGTTPYKVNGVLLSANDTIISNLAAGQYLYTILDSNNCVRPQDTILVEEPVVLEIDTAITDVLCYGYHTAAIDLTVDGGSQPYDYQWTGPGGPYTTADLNNIGAGNYLINILDLNLCPLSLLCNITEPSSAITASVVIGDSILCNGENGDINLSLIGGTPNYTFAWNNASTNEDLLNVGAGTYTVTILDANQCDTTASIILTEPPAITLTSNIINLDCFEDGSGSIAITTAGGTVSYTYEWYDDLTGAIIAGATTEDISGLMKGNYSLTVTDANLCTYTESFPVDQPPLFQTNFITPDQIDCFGYDNGSIDFQATGGTAGYSYSWNSGQTTSLIDNLFPDFYVVTATDANNCSFIDSVEISDPPELILSLISITHAECEGEASGKIDVEVTGGTPGYSYSWTDGTTNQDLLNIQSDSYELEVEDANGCNISGNYFIDQPNPYNETVNTVDIISLNGCYGDAIGSIDFSVVGNTSPYSYVWSNNETTANISNLSAGTYEVSVLDANNCLITYSYIILEPDALVLDYTVTPTSCEEKNDGEIYTSVSGGVSPITYNWIHGESTQNIFYLEKGTYTLQVEDANGCSLPLENIEVNFDGLTGCIEIPSGFTPNGDGVHDEWKIYGLSDFPDVVVQVYNRWGQEVFISKGGGGYWDGKYNGVDLPTAAYYYVIVLNESDKVFNGTVTIKR